MEINGPLVVPLSSPGHTLDSSGGKGLNLALLTMAGFHVPGGFVLTSAAYQRFVEVNHLLPFIQAGLAALTAGPESLEETSKRIREVFSEGFIPEDIKSEILAAYRQLGNGAVAVRSSATTEDLPELSFAGQQDTYLNVTNEDDLLKRVVDCWSSLWTARAIGYRLRQSVPQEGIFLAVVVQRMVQSDVSGVLFTANPLSGLRSEMVIDVTLGLGEALVSGLVKPDHYTVDMLTKNVSEKKLGAKGISIRPMVGGGVERVAEHSATSQALIDEQILELVEVGQRAQDYFGSPQDIEWAFCHDQLFLLQSRPITSLYPLPADVGAGPLKVFSSFASVQGIMDPITPIGQSALKSIFATVAGLFGLRRTEETQNALYTAGERLWANITPLIKNSLGKKIIPVVLEYVEPTIRLSFLQIMDDPRLQPEREGVSFRGRLRLLRFILPVAGNVLLNLLFPSDRRKYIVNRGEVILKRLDLLLSTIHGNPFEKLARQARVLSLFTEKYLNRTFILFVSGVASGMVSWNALSMLFSKFYQAEPEKKEHFSGLILQMTRGMPFNPTTEMDLDLWGMAQSIHRDELSLQAMTEYSPGELSQRYLAAELPSVLTREIRRFLGRYGGRGFGEIDLGRNRWAENPQHVFEMLSSFMQIKDFENSPDAVFGRSVVIATESKEQLISAARALPGWIYQSEGGEVLFGPHAQVDGDERKSQVFCRSHDVGNSSGTHKNRPRICGIGRIGACRRFVLPDISRTFSLCSKKRT